MQRAGRADGWLVAGLDYMDQRQPRQRRAARRARLAAVLQQHAARVWRRFGWPERPVGRNIDQERRPCETFCGPSVPYPELKIT